MTRRKSSSIFIVVAILMIANFQDRAFLSLSVTFVALAYGYISHLEIDELLVISMGFSFYLQFISANFSYYLNFSPSLIVLILVWTNPSFWRGLAGNNALRQTVGVWLAWAISVTIVILLSLVANQVPIASGNVTEIAKLLVAASFGLSVAVITISSRAEDRLRLTRIWVLAASIISTVVLVMFVCSQRFSNPIFQSVGYGSTRLRGTFEDPNLFAVYLLLSVGASLFLGVRNPRPGTVAPVILLSTTLAFTNSRAAMVALGALVLYGVISLRKNHKLMARFALLSGVSLLAFMTTRPLADLVRQIHNSLLANFFNGDGWSDVVFASRAPLSSDIRLKLWETALQNWVANPIFGIGYGQFAKSVVTDTDGKNITGVLVHNTLLSMLTESGVLGFVLFIGPLLTVFWVSLSRMNLEISLVSATFLSSVAMMNAYNLQNAVLVWFAFAVFVGLIVSSSNERLRESHRTRLGFSYRAPA